MYSCTVNEQHYLLFDAQQESHQAVTLPGDRRIRREFLFFFNICAACIFQQKFIIEQENKEYRLSHFLIQMLSNAFQYGDSMVDLYFFTVSELCVDSV